MTSRYIAYTNRAKRELLALSEAMQRRVVAAIDELKSPAVSHQKVKKLKGRKKGEPPIYRVRAGNYRALYTVDEQDGVTILHIRHRSAAYK